MAAQATPLMRAIVLALAANILLVSSAAAAQQTVEYSAWDLLLHRYVKEGFVDYEHLQPPRPRAHDLGTNEQAPGWVLLSHFSSDLGKVDPAQLPSKEAVLAFWINAYNACVMKGILDHSPITSVKDVKGFFDTIRYEVAGESLTLNEIEAKGRALGDWRIHLAVVCGAWSCPPLRSEAYVPERLEEQLADQTRRFLNDPERGLRLTADRVWLSKIFKWYASEIFPGGRVMDQGQLLSVFRPYLDPATAKRFHAKPGVKFLDYDRSLNRQQ